MTETYLAQSPVTDPGAYASWVAELPKDVSAPLGTPRPPSERLVGCCRDFTALFVSFARARGIPARTRVGFAGYFMPGWWLDHVVGEIWDAEQNRWRLIEAEVPPDFVDAGTGGV